MTNKKLSPETQAIMADHGLGQTDVWDCHGTWVILHKALERIAAKKKIKFGIPTIICDNIKDQMVAVLVVGTCGELEEWSIGEAAPYNSKNSYPFAMAEKRGKDRVIMKLLGLHGDFFSEEEADEFKAAKPDQGSWHGPLGITELKKQLKALAGDFENCTDKAELTVCVSSHDQIIEQCKRDLPEWYYGKEDQTGMKDRIDELHKELPDEHRLGE